MNLTDGDKFRYKEMFSMPILSIDTVKRMMIDSIHTSWCPAVKITFKP